MPDGQKFDEGKPNWSLLPYDALEGEVRVLTAGAERYGAYNWSNGIKYSRVYAAAIRHLSAWWMSKLLGQSGMDPETGLSHLDHASCCVRFLSAFEKRGMVDFDDRPEKK